MGFNLVADHKPHAVCVPYPAQGHINPMFKLAKLLHIKGFHITFVNTEYNQKRLLKSRGPNSVAGLPDFRFEAIPDGLPVTDNDNTTQDIPSLCESTSKNCLVPFRNLLYRLNNTSSSSNVPPVSCIVSDGSMSFTLEAAEELGIPQVLFWTPSACGVLAYAHYPFLVERGFIPLKVSHMMRGNGRRGGLLGHSQSRQLPVQDEPNDQLDQSTQGQPQVPSRSTGRSAPDPEGSTASTQHRAIPPPPPPPPITPSSEPAIGSTSGHEGHSVGAAPISSMDGLSLTTFGRKKRIKLINGTLHPSEECAKKMKNIFKERMDPEGHCWKTITPETKEFYWDEFQKYFDWQEVTPLVKEAWRRKAAERYKALMCNVRKGKSKVIVPNSTMQKWKEAWSSPEFKAKSHQFTANRCSEIGGVGAGISRHTGGSVSHATHADRMEAQLGRRPFPYELFHKTHTRKGTSDMVDSRAQSIKDAFLALKEQSSQPQEGCSDPPIVDEVALYYQVVGGEKKNRVYGIGSQASIFYPSSSHGSSSTASYCAQSEAMQEEIQQLHQTIATLKDSLVAMEERDRQRELMLEERYRQREQTLEERMQQMMQNMMSQMMQGTQFTAPTPHATHQDDGREADSGDE